MNDDFAKYITGKLDALTTSVTNIDKTLVKQQEQLAYHIKRTDLAEQTIQVVRDEAKEARAEIVDDLKPIQKHVDRIDGVVKAIGVLSLLVTIAAGILKMLSIV